MDGWMDGWMDVMAYGLVSWSSMSVACFSVSFKVKSLNSKHDAVDGSLVPGTHGSVCGCVRACDASPSDEREIELMLLIGVAAAHWLLTGCRTYRDTRPRLESP